MVYLGLNFAKPISLLLPCTSVTALSHLSPLPSHPPATVTTSPPVVLHLNFLHCISLSLVSLPATTLYRRCHHAPPTTVMASPPLVLHFYFVHSHFVHGHFVHLLLGFLATVDRCSSKVSFPTRFCFVFRFVYINFSILIISSIDFHWNRNCLDCLYIL